MNANRTVSLSSAHSRSLDGNALKLIAITAMLFDHLVYLFSFGIPLVQTGTFLWSLLHIPGKIVAPIMCYFIAEGYHYTSDKWKYLKRLLLFAVISHFPYVLYFQCTWWKTTSIMWGLAMGLGALMAVKSRRLSGLARGGIFLLCCGASLVSTYDVLVVLWIVAFGLYRGDFKRQMQALCLITFIGGPSALLPGLVTTGWLDFYRAGTLLAIPLLALYNGQRGSHSAFAKYAFYVFFPLHHLILYMILCVAKGQIV